MPHLMCKIPKEHNWILEANPCQILFCYQPIENSVLKITNVTNFANDQRQQLAKYSNYSWVSFPPETIVLLFFLAALAALYLTLVSE